MWTDYEIISKAVDMVKGPAGTDVPITCEIRRKPGQNLLWARFGRVDERAGDKIAKMVLFEDILPVVDLIMKCFKEAQPYYKKMMVDTIKERFCREKERIIEVIRSNPEDWRNSIVDLDEEMKNTIDEIKETTSDED